MLDLRVRIATGVLLLGLLPAPASQSVNGAQVLPGGLKSPEDISYTLGPGDEVVISVADAAEIQDLFGNSFQIGSDGYLTLPMVGRIRAVDSTVPQLQSAIVDRLKKFVRDPQGSVNLRPRNSPPVSVLGAVNTPGVHQVMGPKSLAEVLALAGGLSKDAGYKIEITRQLRQGPIPIPNAVQDSTEKYSTVEIRTQDLADAKNPKYNITVRPNDVITVQKAEIVYVIGEVRKPGGFTLGDYRTISVLQALSLAEGATRSAAPGRARILRQAPTSDTRVEIPVNLSKLLAGRAADVPLEANDILIVPDATTKRAAIRIAETAMTTISGLVIWRGF